jgi:hypothetical protein
MAQITVTKITYILVNRGMRDRLARPILLAADSPEPHRGQGHVYRDPCKRHLDNPPSEDGPDWSADEAALSTAD